MASVRQKIDSAIGDFNHSQRASLLNGVAQQPMSDINLAAAGLAEGTDCMP